jgi:hypothetical protein
MDSSISKEKVYRTPNNFNPMCMWHRLSTIDRCKDTVKSRAYDFYLGICRPESAFCGCVFLQ